MFILNLALIFFVAAIGVAVNTNTGMADARYDELTRSN